MRRLRQPLPAESQARQPILERGTAPRAGMDGEPRRLVEDQQGVVPMQQTGLGIEAYRRYRGQTRPWQCLYFFPLPQGQAALRGVRYQVAGSAGSTPSTWRAVAGGGASGAGS